LSYRGIYLLLLYF